MSPSKGPRSGAAPLQKLPSVGLIERERQGEKTLAHV